MSRTVAGASAAGALLCAALLLLDSPDGPSVPASGALAARGATPAPEGPSDAAPLGGAAPPPAPPPPRQPTEATTAATSSLPATPATLYLHLEVGRDAARPALLARSEVPFRPPRDPLGPFVLEVVSQDGASFHLPFAARGLLPEGVPQALLDEEGRLVVGDELYLARVPLILKLPDLPLPLACVVRDDGGRALGRFELPSLGPLPGPR